jgi:hypothetical protein
LGHHRASPGGRTYLDIDVGNDHDPDDDNQLAPTLAELYTLAVSTITRSTHGTQPPSRQPARTAHDAPRPKNPHLHGRAVPILTTIKTNSTIPDRTS